MEKLRRYGDSPFTVAVIHGGPGAPGEMAPVARELSRARGVLEPLQAAATLEGQVQELRAVLEGDAALPVTLVGFSWGAMLGFILAARHPSLVRKLILIGSGVFEQRYATDIMETRLGRLSEGERAEALALMERLSGDENGRDALMARLGRLIARADAYDPLPQQDEMLECQHDVYRSVWQQAAELRGSGRLLALGEAIRCAVVAIHGDYDPHPAAGVRAPLSRVLKDFRFILLERCGHRPWLERGARDRFYDILNAELSAG